MTKKAKPPTSFAEAEKNRAIGSLVPTIQYAAWDYGQARGVEEAAKFLEERAVKLFIEGNDDAAIILRAEARELKALSERQFAAWRKKNEGAAACFKQLAEIDPRLVEGM